VPVEQKLIEEDIC